MLLVLRLDLVLHGGAWRPRNYEHAGKCRRAAIQEHHDLLELRFLEVPVQDGGADDCGEGEEYELNRYNRLVKGMDGLVPRRTP